MLSNAEQRRLIEIESQLRADDPVFVRRFDDRGQRRLRQRWTSLATLLVVIVAVTGIGLALDSVGTVVVALTAVGASAGMWITRRRT